jgi:soluble lytic murein transglycosylase-like protein
LVAFAAAAEMPAIGGSTGFKRIKVSESTAGKRITVQIDPVAQAAYLASMPKVDPDGVDAFPAEEAVALAPAAPTSSNYSWFWDKVPASLSEKDGRFPLALASLGLGPEGKSVPGPRLQSLQQVAADYGKEILIATVGTQVSPALVLAVMSAESAGRPDALSDKGAQGLMQLIPATAERFGVSDSTDPAQNIRGGVAYLDWLMKEFDRDPLMVIAAYNAGEGAVKANSGVPPYAETRDYVPKVLAAWQVAQGLCITPPELMTDPCVFKVISASN